MPWARPPCTWPSTMIGFTDGADVVDRDVGADLHESGLGVDLGRAQVGAVREREVVRIVGRLGVQRGFDAVWHGVCAAKVASAISWMLLLASGSPRTENFPAENSRSSADASSMAAAITLALVTTLSQACTRAMPPTASERDP